MTGLAKRRHYWACQAASLLGPPSGVITGPAKRRFLLCTKVVHKARQLSIQQLLQRGEVFAQVGLKILLRAGFDFRLFAEAGGGLGGKRHFFGYR